MRRHTRTGRIVDGQSAPKILGGRPFVLNQESTGMIHCRKIGRGPPNCLRLCGPPLEEGGALWIPQHPGLLSRSIGPAAGRGRRPRSKRRLCPPRATLQRPCPMPFPGALRPNGRLTSLPFAHRRTILFCVHPSKRPPRPHGWRRRFSAETPRLSSCRVATHQHADQRRAISRGVTKHQSSPRIVGSGRSVRMSLCIQCTSCRGIAPERPCIGPGNADSSRLCTRGQCIQLPADPLGLPTSEPNAGEGLVRGRKSRFSVEGPFQVHNHLRSVRSSGCSPCLLNGTPRWGNVVRTLGFEQGRPGEPAGDDVMGVPTHGRCPPQMDGPVLGKRLQGLVVDGLEISPGIDPLQLLGSMLIQEILDE